jgi:hypothetical protein
VNVFDFGIAERVGERSDAAVAVLRWEAIRARRICGVICRNSFMYKLRVLRQLRQLQTMMESGCLSAIKDRWRHKVSGEVDVTETNLRFITDIG